MSIADREEIDAAPEFLPDHRLGTLFRALWAAVFLGGVGRLLSWLIIGAPPGPYVGFLLLEIVGAPVFIYWQSRVAQPALAP